MYFLVRTVTGRDSAEALDSEYEGEVLTLGADSEAMVHLAVSGALRITGSSRGVGSVTVRKLDLEVNGEAVKSADVGVGDVLRVPGYSLEIIEPPAGFDFALQLAASGAARPPCSTGLDIEDSAWSMRRTSWCAAGLILLLCLVLPLLGIFDDGMWSTGPLASAHRTAGLNADCRACHVDHFVMVEDGACLSCHRGTREHVDLAVLEQSRFSPQHFTAQRCASCHREHNEPAHLVRRDKPQCVECHGNSDEGHTQVQAVSGFTADTHPPFRLALLTPQGPGGIHGWEEKRVRPGVQELQETSNLKFSHREHLDPDKVRETSTDAALQCASCHTLKDDGEHFEPVTMDSHCRRCHSLSFDIFEPELELPHGNLRAAIVAMEAHFIREFTDPKLRAQRAREKPRRVPGRRQAAASCVGTGLDCGRAEALKEAQYQFANTGCISCHEVENTGLADISDRWYVQPIRISGDWYPHSRFDHGSHLNLALEDEDGDVCETCHEAGAGPLSQNARSILIPGQDNCLDCHNEDRGNATVDCVGCHVFHYRGGSLAARARGGEDRP